MNRTPLALVTALVGSLLVTACGSDGGAEPPPAPPPAAANDVPSEAGTSPAALVTWMGTQAASNTAEPLKVEGFMPPTSDTEEPVPLT